MENQQQQFAAVEGGLTGSQLVGQYVYLYVPCDNIYMKAKVCKYSSNRNLHCVEYTADKEREAISLEKVTWELCSANDPNLKPLPKHPNFNHNFNINNIDEKRSIPNIITKSINNIATNNTININNIIKKTQNNNINQQQQQQQQQQQWQQIQQQQIQQQKIQQQQQQQQKQLQQQQQIQIKQEIPNEKQDENLENVLNAAYLRIEQLQNTLKYSREELSQIQNRHQIRKSELTNTISVLQEKMSAMEEEEVDLKSNVAELQQQLHDALAAQQLKAFQSQNATVIPIKQQGWPNGSILPNKG